MSLRSLIFGGLLLFLLIPSIGFGQQSNTYISWNDLKTNDIDHVEDLVIKAGGRVNHIFPPDELICYIPENNRKKLQENTDLNIVTLSDTRFVKNNKIGCKVWDYLKNGFPQLDNDFTNIEMVEHHNRYNYPDYFTRSKMSTMRIGSIL